MRVRGQPNFSIKIGPFSEICGLLPGGRLGGTSDGALLPTPSASAGLFAVPSSSQSAATAVSPPKVCIVMLFWFQDTVRSLSSSK